MSHFRTSVNPYSLGYNRQGLLGPPAVPNMRDGSFTLGQQQYGLAHPVTSYQWSPGLGEMTAAEKLTLVTAGIAAAAGQVGQIVNAPQLAKEQRRLVEAEARRDAARSANTAAVVKNVVTVAGLVLGAGLAVKVLSAGAAKMRRRRKR